MKRIAMLMAMASLVSAGLTLAQSKPKTMTAVGFVKTVAADSLGVNGGPGKDWTFTIDATTKIIAKGGTHKSDAAKDAGKPLMITDIVKEGQRVQVKYHDMDGKMHAAQVRVM